MPGTTVKRRHLYSIAVYVTKTFLAPFVKHYATFLFACYNKFGFYHRNSCISVMVMLLPQQIQCLQKTLPWKPGNNPILLTFGDRTNNGHLVCPQVSPGTALRLFLPYLFFFFIPQLLLLLFITSRLLTNS